jgi:inorganic pyrophosphatase
MKYAEWRPHPWHGLEAGRELPHWVNAYIEITPFDLIKYEVDKASGYLRVDRPQRTSSQPPSLYGFVPRTYCGAKIAALCPGAERGAADDKLIAVLEADFVWGNVTDLGQLPPILVERLQHYFTTYKLVPNTPAYKILLQS